MSETEAAWLAGFLDGEGSILPYMGGRGGKYKSWKITAPNTHKGSLVRCQEVTGVGNISLKYEATERRKQQWQWAANSQREIKDILSQIYPYLVIKKDQADVFLGEFREI